jgi:hypothetical protein
MEWSFKSLATAVEQVLFVFVQAVRRPERDNKQKTPKDRQGPFS